MQFTDEEIARYQEIVYSLTKTRLSKEEVVKQGRRVVDFFSILIDIDKRTKNEERETSTT